MSEESKLRRELAKADMKIEEAIEAQAEAEYEYASWRKEKSNILRALTALNNQKESREEKV